MKLLKDQETWNALGVCVYCDYKSPQCADHPDDSSCVSGCLMKPFPPTTWEHHLETNPVCHIKVLHAR